MDHNLFDTWTSTSLARLAPFLPEENISELQTHLLALDPAGAEQCIMDLCGSEVDVLDFIQEYLKKRFGNKKSEGWANGLGVNQGDVIMKVASPKIDVKKNGFPDIDKNTRHNDIQDGKKGKNKTKKSNKKNMEIVGTAEPGFNGAIVCECQASLHPLVTNCLSCGKIICEAEQTSDSTCNFCGVPLTSNIGDLIANERRDTLLEYDRNSTARTHVIDVASDFDSRYDRWKTQDERIEIERLIKEKEEKESEGKKRRVITLDLENGRVFAEKPVEVKEVVVGAVKVNTHGTGVFRNPNLAKKPLIFTSSVKREKGDESISVTHGKTDVIKNTINRLQDEGR